MSNSPAPTNFNWVGDTLTFTLDPVVTGVKIQFQKEDDPEWILLLEVEASTNPPTSCNLPSSWGPKGTIWGATKDSSGTQGDWGDANIQEISNVSLTE